MVITIVVAIAVAVVVNNPLFERESLGRVKHPPYFNKKKD